MVGILRNPLLFILGATGILLVSSCYPGNSVFETEDLDLVVTLYDENADFNSKGTYILPDTIVPIGGEGSQFLLTGEFDRQILDEVRANLNAYGWQEVEPGADADVVVLLSKVASLNIEAYSWYDYWWGWWGWYPYWPGVGWTPWYPWGGTIVYAYETGTLFIEMIDPNQPGPEEMTILSIWTAGVNGLLEGSNAEISRRLDSNLDQIFVQSPYLQLN